MKITDKQYGDSNKDIQSVPIRAQDLIF